MSHSAAGCGPRDIAVGSGNHEQGALRLALSPNAHGEPITPAESRLFSGEEYAHIEHIVDMESA
ncbi:MAG TPA: hypothetical protein VE665_00740, partial [Hyphomicrobiaceae bacterium]|nr:hypothetical protein [Hyphomicrobiaceae bacterium]